MQKLATRLLDGGGKVNKNFKIEAYCPRCKEDSEITIDYSIHDGYESAPSRCKKCKLSLTIHFSPRSDECLICWDPFRHSALKSVSVAKKNTAV